MGSLFINAGLAAGVALAAVPVILHLFMKQTPKQVIFPALRLIKERQKRSKKRLRVKNWLLLLARMLLLALMALALARPRINAQANLGTGDEPTAIAFVFDTSLSMSYKELGKTRLDESKELARQVLKAMNDQSRVFVIDSSDPGPPIASTPAAARKRIDGLQVHAVNRTLNGAIGAAYTAVAGVDLTRREVYILTDLAASQWQTGQEVEGLAQATKTLKKNGKIDTFVLKVGSKDLRDVAIVSAEPTSPVATEDDPVNIKVRLRNIGPAAKRIVELRMDGNPDPRAKVPVVVPPTGEETVTMVTPKLSSGLHQIEIKIVGEPDPLEFDDVTYLTLDVQPAIKILVIADTPIDSQFVAYALDPPSRPENVPRPFQVERVQTSQLDNALGTKTLKSYSGIFVLNVKELSESWWSRFLSYARDGGGLVVAPAGSSNPENYNRGTASELLPATIDSVRVHKESDPPFRFGTPDLGNPIFAQNQKELLAEISRAPIYKTWAVTPDQGGARVLLRYTDESPALLEKVFAGPRAGKVLMWTTALSRRPIANDPQAWNDFPLPVAGWGFFALMDQTAYYLAGTAGQRLIFESGEDATLAVDATRPFSGYTVKGPNGKTSDRTAESAGTGMVLVASPGEIGQWRVTATSKDGPSRDLGFSVNPPHGEVQTTTLENKDLDVLFGKGNYQLATDAASLKHVQGVAIYGREIFPWVMALILLIVTFENVLANTFYREKSAGSAVAARAA